MSQLIPTEEGRRPFPAIGAMALVTGVALLMTYERLESIAEFWGGGGRYILIGLAAYLILWGIKQSLGTILPGCATIKGEEKDLDVVSVFEAVGKHANGDFSDEELEMVEKCAIPGPGSCRLPNLASPLPGRNAKARQRRRCG